MKFMLCLLFIILGINSSAFSDSEAIKTGDKNNAYDWPSVGGTYGEQHYSALQDIDSKNINKLGLAWSLDIPGAVSIEATPLVVNGVIYFTTSESVVYAADARTGKVLWRHDPEVWRVAGKRLRNLFHVNRGVAYWKGRIYFGSFDGRLIALDAKSGSKVWEVMTLDEFPTGFITGAPRAFNDKIIIGNGGAESGRARGFVTAYDARTGEKLWRFFTVPGDPSQGFENKAMAMAAKTWTGEWWKFGGGGTVWNAMTYDPEFNRIYLGTGNGTPWNRKIRSPGGGDNLFLCSIVALDADTGEYVWHYQTTPGESWDYNSSMDITLADLKINGAMKKVILHAPKNGFFYVIDRTSGKLISAEKIGKVTWAEKIDIASGRPIENPEARSPNGALVWPSSTGMHNWQAMSFNPTTGLVYLPKTEMPQYYSDANLDKAAWKLSPNFYRNTGYNPLELDVDSPPPAHIKLSAALLAWNPVTQTKAWEVPMAGLWNGGTLTTAGNLVFHGNATGEFAAYDASSGTMLWSFSAGLGIVAAPVTYKLGDTQYVTIAVGWGGSLSGAFGIGVAQHGWNYGKQPRRLLTFALNGNAVLPKTPAPEIAIPIDDAALAIDSAEASKGRALFNTSCALCHGWEGVAGGTAPDLRASPIALNQKSFAFVLKAGPLESRGMPKFDDLSDTEIKQLHQFLRDRARKDIKK
jgi:quinohemoprotein ethanol dehydrogenase